MNDTATAGEMKPRKETDNPGSSTRLRVLHVISGLGPGGSETVLYRLATSTNRVEHEVICLGPPEWFSRKLEECGVAVHHVDLSPGLRLLAELRRFHRLIRASSADLVQGWMYRANVLGGLSGWLDGKPIVWNIRCSTSDRLPLGSRALARVGGLLARCVPEMIINCSAVSREMHALLGYDSAGGTVIPNGYDSSAFRPDDPLRAATREALGISPGTFAIGAIGRWDACKGYPALLRALRQVRDRGISFRLLLVGRGLEPSNRELARIIEENGCGEFVEAIGFRSDVADIARALDLHVLSSVTEGFPNVVAETMLSGTPNVATDVGDSALIVGKTGWVVSPDDDCGLADAIEQARAEWASRPERWQKRRAAARERIVGNYSIDRMVQAYETVWNEVAARSAERSPMVHPSRVPPPRRASESLKKPLRVLHVINSLALGGAETLLYRLATYDRRNAHVVVSLGRPAWYSDELLQKGVELHHLHMDAPTAVPLGLRRLNKIVRESRADVVQCWMYRSNVLGGLVAKAVGKPVIWGIHCSDLAPLKPSSRALARLSGALARWNPDFVINCSTRSAELHQKLGYPPGRTGIIHNGYDASAFFPDDTERLAAREALGLARDGFAIGTIARWHAQKDIPNLLAAARIARDRGALFHCFLIGAGLGQENAKLLEEIERSGCREFVTSLGPRGDVQNLARALDLHVLASCGAEAFPNVVAESMLSGTPNVVTDIGDSALMVGETGWVVPPRDPQRLADAIVEAHSEWRDSEGDWAARRRAARSQIADNFSFERMAREYERVWREVIAS